ncbi:hypothetical protein BVX94_02035 [bacterium B17]|nr:hypothetical protein BVX94_02035 [bacterium B17]
MNNATVNEAMARRVIESMGFPRNRVDVAVSCLVSEECPVVDDILSFNDVCRRLSLSKSGLRRIINAGELTPIHLTQRRIGFRTQDVARFIESRESAHLLDNDDTS